MKLNEVITSKTQTILNEGWQDLNEAQQNYLTRFELELWPLVESYAKLAEAELTPDQIQAIFKGAEETAMASGDNKTALGKAGSAVGAAAKLPVDLAKKVDAKINELGKLAQNAGPIKNADAKFEELKKKIGSGDSKIVAGVKAVSDWAKANPGKASLAVGILTTVAAFAGGPLGGAAAGLVLRSTKDLLQGEKLSGAVGKSLKTAAYGALAGATFKYISSEIVDNIATAQVSELNAMEAAMKSENFATAKEAVFADLGVDVDALDGAVRMKIDGSLNAFNYSYDTVIPGDMMAQYTALEAAVDGAKDFSPEHYKAFGEFHDFMANLVRSENAKDLTAVWDALKQVPRDALTMDQLQELVATAESGDVILDNLTELGGAVAAAAQGAMQTVDDTAKNAQSAKPIPPEEKEQLELDLKGGSDATPVDKNFDKSQKLSDFGAVGDKAESIDYNDAFNKYLQEADPVQQELPLDNPNSLGAKLKRGAGKVASKAAGAVKQGAKSAVGAVKQGAKDVSNKVTANKLNKDWKKMGEPTDSGSIVNILSGAGLTNDQISSIAGSTQAPISPDEAKPSTDGAADATQASTASDNTKDTQTPAKPTNTPDKPAQAEPTSTGVTPADDEYDPKGKVRYKTGGAQGDKVKYDTGTPATNDKVDNNKDGKDDTTGYPMGGAKGTGAKNLDSTNTAGTPTKPGKQEPSSKPTTPKKPGSNTATPTQSNVKTLAQKIKQSGANTDSIKRDLAGGSTTSQGSTVDLSDLATRIAKAGVQKQVRQMLIAK